jgi:hypothetical protein
MKDIPYSLKWITILSQEDPSYLNTMWSTMQGNRFDSIRQMLGNEK